MVLKRGSPFERVSQLITKLRTGQLILPQVNDAAKPALAFGDGNTGFYESADNVLRLSIAGVERFVITSGYIRTSPGQSALMNDVATATLPNLVPDYADFDTGIGKAGLDTLSLIAGGVECIRVTETAGAITNNLNGQTILPLSNTPATPTLAFGDGDTGFYESVDDSIAIALSGLRYYKFNTARFINDSAVADGFSLELSGPTSTAPNIIPNRTDLNTGIGHAAADALSLIAGGVEGIRITEAAGAIAVDVNGGLNAKGCVALEKGIQYNRVAVAASTYTTTIDDSIIGVTYTASGAVTITISSAHIAMQGKDIRIVDEGGNAGTNNITIATEGGEKISGADTQTISADYGRLRIYTDGSNCFLS